MKTAITKGLTEEQADEITQSFKASAFLRSRLIKILHEKENTIRTAVRQKASYESPSWAYVQADALGYERAIFELISLLSSDSGEK